MQEVVRFYPRLFATKLDPSPRGEV
jgi:hypothetical protein